MFEDLVDRESGLSRSQARKQSKVPRQRESADEREDREVVLLKVLLNTKY